MTTLETIEIVLADYFSIKESDITPEKRFAEDFGADSLDHLELVIAIEDEFGIELPEDEAQAMRTVSDAVALVEKYTAA